MSEVYYTGSITVRRQDGTARTYDTATRPRQFFRAAPTPMDDVPGATPGRCEACNITAENGTEWCIGIAGGCPRAVREDV